MRGERAGVAGNLYRAAAGSAGPVASSDLAYLYKLPAVLPVCPSCLCEGWAVNSVLFMRIRSVLFMRGRRAGLFGAFQQVETGVVGRIRGSVGRSSNRSRRRLSSP